MCSRVVAQIILLTMRCMREREYVVHSIYTQSACPPAIKSWRKFGWGKVISVGAWEYFHRDVITAKMKKTKYNTKSALASLKEGPVKIPRVDKSLVLSVVFGITTKIENLFGHYSIVTIRSLCRSRLAAYRH